ncbi:MAG: OmpA family protein [Dysgonamonadaceae bacterium]|jgi:outer membrane protein OmpA-like peptidoglycan-associated protein|nr:OmpA family protein [Dysgonamonadaceae bacterium]
MKTKILCVSLILSSLAFFTAAQETLQNELKTAGYKTAFKHSGAGENWFFHIGAGGQVFFGDNDLSADVGFGERFTLMPEVAIGKWFNPYWALRLKGQGGALHGFEDDGLYMQHLKYYNLHLDAMWNLANYWGTYIPSKVVSFGPYIGLGFAHRFEMDKTIPLPPTPPSHGVAVNAKNYHRYSNAISINTGLNLGFNVSERISLDFDLGAAIVPDYFDRIVHNAENELIVGISGGVTFKLGKVGFESVEPMNYALINDLNGKINALRSENAQLAKRPVSCPECPQVAPVVKADEINYVPNVVFFRLNSAKIDVNQQISIYNTAEFMKKTGEKIKVVGYADKATGTSNYNLDISKRRAQSVAKELTTKYKIPSEKITVEWKGSGEQPYPKNNWNRVVIMSAPN